MVRADSSEADEWPSRKPKAGRRFRNAQDAVLGSAGGEFVRRAALPVRRALGKAVAPIASGTLAAVRAARAGLTKVPGGSTDALAAIRAAAGKVGATGALGAGATGVVLAAAGLLSYWITKKLLEIPERRRQERAAKAAAAADAFRESHREMAKKLGRPLTIGEAQSLGVAFKAELKKLGLSSTDLGGL